MIGRQVIETKRAFTLQELFELMQKNWDKNEYNDFIIGKPTTASVEEYILLPATRRFMVIVYSRKAGGLFNKSDKVILAVCDTPSGFGDRLLSSIPSKNMFYNIWTFGENMSIEKERKGPAEEAIQKYAAYLRDILKNEGLTK